MLMNFYLEGRETKPLKSFFFMIKKSLEVTVLKKIEFYVSSI